MSNHRTPRTFHNHPTPYRTVRPPAWAGVVEDIVDGDTVDVLVSLGWGRYEYVAVRLAGINANETNDPDPIKRAHGVAAADYLRGRIIGSQCEVRNVLKKSFERYVGELWVWEKGAYFDVAAELVALGLAVPV